MNIETEQMLAVIDALPDPVFILTENGRYAGIVGGRDSRYYHDGSVLVGKSLFDVLPEDKAKWFLEQIRSTIKANQLHTVEYALGGHDVEGLDVESGPAGVLWFEGRIQPLNSLYDNERAVVWVARNITERYTLETKLRHLSELDALTGAYNRRRFLFDLKERFAELKRYNSPTALLMIDIDHFKQVNDQFGHLNGDIILNKVAQICMHELREIDHFARFGGEEFAAILPHTHMDEAKQIAERLRKSIDRKIELSDLQSTTITASIGVSEMFESDTREDDVIRRADEALYRAKRQGRNRVISD
ncbi:MAG: diguanylate cyclase [Gammaproteobacteria bacterium]|nr:diguanylate cyclase [Gammaproteobacteria bacterium]